MTSLSAGRAREVPTVGVAVPILLSALVALFDQISRVKFNQTAKNALPVHFVCLDQNFPLCAIPDGCRPLLVQARRQLVLHVQLVHTAHQYFGRQQIVILRHVQVCAQMASVLWGLLI